MSILKSIRRGVDSALARFAEAFPESMWYILDANDEVNGYESPADHLPPAPAPPIGPLRPDRLTDREALSVLGRMAYDTALAVCSNEQFDAGHFIELHVSHAVERSMEYFTRDAGRLGPGERFRDVFLTLAPDPCDMGPLRSNPRMIYDKTTDQLIAVCPDRPGCPICDLTPDTDPDHAHTITH